MFLRSTLLLLGLLWTIVSAHHHHCDNENRPTVYLIRHGEKPEDKEDHRLTREGKQRAQCLRSVFGAESGYNISYIIAPRVKWNGDHARPYDTVLPLAQDLGLEIDTHCSRKKGKCVAKAIRRYDGPGNILISWRHGTILDIEEYLGMRYPEDYPLDRFDIIWTIPYPYKEITDARSEECPGIDVASSEPESEPGLVAQY